MHYRDYRVCSQVFPSPESINTFSGIRGEVFFALPLQKGCVFLRDSVWVGGSSWPRVVAWVEAENLLLIV